MNKKYTLKYILQIALISFLSNSIGIFAEDSILNVSYDPTRELYKEYNTLFANHWKRKTGKNVSINQSHAGSGKQSRAVIDGLKADVVTLALEYDIDTISEKSGLISKDWKKRLPNNSSPYKSAIVFLVRKGNPKNIRDWKDIIAPAVAIVTPNPKTSGGARWNYLAAWGYALQENKGDEPKAKNFVSALYKNVKVLDTGARGATTTFVNNRIGDVLIAWENEAFLARKEFPDDGLEIIIPSVSILAEPSVSVVDLNADNKKVRPVAEEYLKFLYSPEAQELIAKNFYRPVSETVAKKYSGQFKKIKLFTIDSMFGGWKKAQEKHFRDGGIFDEIYSRK